VQEAYSSTRNPRGMKSGGVHGIGLLWSIHQAMDIDYKNQYATKRHVHECINNLQIHGTNLTDFTFITAIKACQK